MGYTGLDGHQPGFTLAIDRGGKLVDICANITERWIELGYAWRIGDGYKTLAATTNKRLITFKTPAAGNIYYAFADIQKSGSELTVILNEGGTVAGGAAITPLNLNRALTTVNPFTYILGGLSTDGTPMTVTGGVVFPAKMLPGAAAGASSMPGCGSTGAVFIRLKNDTVYTIVMEAIGGAVTCTAMVDIAVTP